MWRPRSYADIQAAIGNNLTEDSQLDFKSATSNATEIAKDIAAMTIEGGVIVYGVDEQNGVATVVTNVALAGEPERIQQIVDTRIKPVPAIEIESFPVTTGASNGVVVVTVPPSPLAPHWANDRFPARSGATTRYLAEAEIAALYEQRRRVSESVGEASRMSTFVAPHGSPNAQDGIGMMRMLVAPLATVRHPLGAHLESALSSAVAEAARTMASYLDALEAKAFDWLYDWRPLGVDGWQAGGAGSDEHGVFVAAAYTHSGSFSFQASMSVATEGDERVAFEHLWAVELMACLCVAGIFLRSIPGISIVQCEVELKGLERAVSWRRSHGRFFTGLPRVEASIYHERAPFGARDLARDPRDAARLLLDRLFASFLDEGTDVVADVGSGVYSVGPMAPREPRR